jgi:hypothetical protein
LEARASVEASAATGLPPADAVVASTAVWAPAASVLATPIILASHAPTLKAAAAGTTSRVGNLPLIGFPYEPREPLVVSWLGLGEISLKLLVSRPKSTVSFLLSDLKLTILFGNGWWCILSIYRT